jgi:hypothetical protein
MGQTYTCRPEMIFPNAFGRRAGIDLSQAVGVRYVECQTFLFHEFIRASDRRSAPESFECGRGHLQLYGKRWFDRTYRGVVLGR